MVFLVHYFCVICCVCAWFRSNDTSIVRIVMVAVNMWHGGLTRCCCCRHRFLNYKLKSVAHLPWRVLVYKSLNTFIDDLFSFIIRMPTMARISCFRDDVVFFIYLYQRWLYPVDASRPIEGGGDGSDEGPIVRDDRDTNSKKNR